MTFGKLSGWFRMEIGVTPGMPFWFRIGRYWFSVGRD